MGPKIYLGVNLSFTKYVYGRKRAVEVVRRRLGLRQAEFVADNDYGGVFYARAPAAFRDHHYEIADHARSQGLEIAGVFTVYRESGAIAHPDSEIRESAYEIGLSIIEQAACYGARYMGSSMFTMNKETAEDPEQFQMLHDAALDAWRRWMGDAKRLGLDFLVVEMSAAYREGCSTIDDTRNTLDKLLEHHGKNPDTTVPVRLCYDLGHGISPTENRDDANRDYRAWFGAFPDSMYTLHLKNTDADFLETKHLHEDGIIDIDAVLRAVRDTLTVPEVYLHLEVPGKRGRDIGEELAIDGHLRSIELVRRALSKAGYVQDDEGLAWLPS